jgi:hypothetical protein
MKTILVAASLLASLSFAANSPIPTKAGAPGESKDTAKYAPALHRDSLKLPVLPDSLKAKVEQQIKEFDAKKVEFGKDSAKEVGLKVSVDSLRKTFEAKRDTQVAAIRDTAVRTNVEARIVKVSEHKAAVQPKIEAKKAQIEAKKAVKPSEPATK